VSPPCIADRSSGCIGIAVIYVTAVESGVSEQTPTRHCQSARISIIDTTTKADSCVVDYRAAILEDQRTCIVNTTTITVYHTTRDNDSIQYQR